jgi:hypothetical protein
MVGVSSLVEICLVTADAITGRIGVVVMMTTIAIVDSMPKREREKRVIYADPGPGNAVYRMTFKAIC